MTQLLLAGVSGGLIIDIIVLVVVLIFTIMGIVNGFTKTFFAIFGTILSILFAVLLCNSVVNFFNDKFGVVNALGDGLAGVLTGALGDELMNTTWEQAQHIDLNNLGAPVLILNIIFSLQEKNAQIPPDTTLNKIVCPTFAYYICLIIAVIVLIIVFKIIFFIIGEIVSNAKKAKTLTFIDKILGIFIGFLQGVVWVEIVIMIIGVLPFGFCQDFILLVETAPFANFINKINVFQIIMKVISLGDIVSFVGGLFV